MYIYVEIRVHTENCIYSGQGGFAVSGLTGDYPPRNHGQTLSDKIRTEMKRCDKIRCMVLHNRPYLISAQFHVGSGGVSAWVPSTEVPDSLLSQQRLPPAVNFLVSSSRLIWDRDYTLGLPSAALDSSPNGDYYRLGLSPLPRDLLNIINLSLSKLNTTLIITPFTLITSILINTEIRFQFTIRL